MTIGIQMNHAVMCAPSGGPEWHCELSAAVRRHVYGPDFLHPRGVETERPAIQARRFPILRRRPAAAPRSADQSHCPRYHHYCHYHSAD